MTATLTPLRFVQIQYGSPLYERACALRDQILRRPIGLTLSSQDTAGEDRQWHFGLVQGTEEIVATILANPVAPEVVRIRQMTVAPHLQGRGLGRCMILAVEQHVYARGIAEVMLHARRTMAGFYRKLGYLEEGEEFTEVTLPHIRMRKILPDGEPPPTLDIHG